MANTWFARTAKKPTLRAIRGRYGVPVARGLGVLRLLMCSHCKTKNLSATIVVAKRNADAIIEAIKQT